MIIYPGPTQTMFGTTTYWNHFAGTPLLAGGAIALFRPAAPWPHFLRLFAPNSQTLLHALRAFRVLFRVELFSNSVAHPPVSRGPIKEMPDGKRASDFQRPPRNASRHS